ncbi:cutinase family protein [Streptomyces sp. NPDC005525]|uniref:cutinase family protein n=1 Tax=Streptomyces sp. NPDC005525 TaxID=3364720 RepID=UPI00369AE579
MWRYWACLIAGLSLAFGAGATPSQAASYRPAADCPLTFIGAHGLNEDWKSTTISNTWKSFNPARRGDAPHSLHYPKMKVSQFFNSEVVGAQAVSATTVGAGFLNKEISAVRASCSSARFVLAGYSEGAWVIDRYLRQKHDYELRDVVAAVVLYGDPQQDNGSEGKGIAQRYGHGVSSPYIPSELSDRVKTFCNDRDPICGKGYANRSATEQMHAAISCTNASCPHFSYATNGDTEKGGSFLASKAIAGKSADWRNRTYALTCDDTVDKPVRVAVRNGTGIAKDASIGAGKRWDVKVQRTSQGRLPRLGSVTAVLFYCSPQPSNFFKQELRVYRTNNGREVGRTPTFDVPGLSPKYQPKSLVIKDGLISSNVKFYGPEDSHAKGPSILRHVTWSWEDNHFVTHGAEVKSEAPGRVDLTRQPITVNGMGPLEMGMSRDESEKVIGMSIPGEENHTRVCTDFGVEGGPAGLLLRFASDRLVAITVRAPSTQISTRSGIHIGSTRSAVLGTYAGEVTATTPDYGGEELVFAPVAPKFAGKVIVFSMSNGAVESFIAGERDWATFGPSCGTPD